MVEARERLAVRTVFLGPPGAGKGTQASKLASSRQAAHIATGDLFRAAVAEGSDLGKKVKEYLTSGRLVPDDLVIDLVDWRLRKSDAERAFVLDGFPRTVPQAEALGRLLAERGNGLATVLCFDVADDVLIGRAGGRMVCRGCGATYNADSAPPKVAGVCDKCGSPLYRRDDDRTEVVQERLRVYRKQTEPLIEFYQKQSLLHVVNADRPIDVVFREIDRIFLKYTDQRPGPAAPSSPADSSDPSAASDPSANQTTSQPSNSETGEPPQPGAATAH